MAKKLIPEELDLLIQEYLADGVLTNKERQVILKKAESMGLDHDEIDLYLDAQVQKIDQATDSAIRRQKGKTCPYCGGSVPQLSDKCPHCERLITPEATEELQEILDNLEDALVDMKAGRDYARNKAIVERYSRKARLYYSNHPKIKRLLEEVDYDVKGAEANLLLAEKKEKRATVMAKLEELVSKAWFWKAVLLVIGVLFYAIGVNNLSKDIEKDFASLDIFLTLGNFMMIGVIIWIIVDIRRKKKNNG